MKNRRTVIVAFLLCAIMVMGVGFATISGELSITGNLSSTPEDFAVIFTHATKEAETSNGVSVNFETNQEELTNVSLRAVSVGVSNLKSTDDKAVVKFTIKNNNEMAMYCTASIDTSKAAGFSVDWDDAWDNTVTIAAGQTATMTITVMLAGAITDAATGSFVVNINATSDAPAANNP